MPIDIQTLRQVCRVAPDDPVVRFALGQKLFEEDGSGEALREATEHLEFVRDNDARNAAAIYVLAQVYVARGQLDAARETLHAARERIASRADIDGTDLLPQIEALLDEIAE
ncbi:MAG: tetratricopeptide repeat protein [Candidatus Sumerlaeia bacterium]|nr:tetratricopeptide repeat protein [Candidatus Sumerlaeia bacterium]